MILLRNCPHNNDIVTLRDDGAGVIIKSSCSIDGVKRLRREYKGYQWYFDLAGFTDTPSVTFRETGNGSYARLTVSRFAGQIGDPYQSLSLNKNLLLSAIDLYCQLWPKGTGQLAPLHGDFSPGNLVVRTDDIVIIDWEHFHVDAAPWGFDLVSLLYESAFMSFKNDVLHRRDERVFSEIYKIISSLVDAEEGFVCSLDHLTQFIADNERLWEGLVGKLPVTMFSSAQRECLMKLER